MEAIRPIIRLTDSEIAAWVAVFFLVVFLFRYGKKSIEWLLMTLYDLFIQRSPLGL